MNLEDFTDVLQAGAESSELRVSVQWDGTIPQGFSADSGSGYGFAATLLLTFDYIPE